MAQQLAILLALGLLAAGALPGAAEPRLREDDDRLVLENEFVVVALQGKKPMLEVREAANESRSYRVFLQRLVEVPPTATALTGEAVAWFNLARAENWSIEQREDAEGVHVTLQREGPVMARGALGPPAPLPAPLENLTRNLTRDRTLGNASVGIAFHLFAQPRALESGNATFNVTVREVKFDLAVEEWPWTDRRNVLALELLLVTEGEGRNVTAERNATADRGADRLDVARGNTIVGFVSWATEAAATLGNNTTSARVEHREPGSLGRGQGQGEEPMGAKHWLVYQAPGFDSLEHDPSVGIEPTPPEALRPTGLPAGAQSLLLPVVVVGVALAALAGWAWGARKRPKKR